MSDQGRVPVGTSRRPTGSGSSPSATADALGHKAKGEHETELGARQAVAPTT